MKKSNNSEIITIQQPEYQYTTVKIVGDTSLIVHAWSPKAKQMMIDNQTGKTPKTKAKELRNPEAEFITSMYWLSGKPEIEDYEAFEQAVADGATFGFPATAIKQAALSAAYRIGALKNKVSISGLFFINGVDVDGNDLVQINVPEHPIMREDMVKIGMGVADLRYRGEFKNWSMEFKLKFLKNGPITLEQIINMINLGGFMVGIGEWRPEKSGQSGMFHVVAG